MENYKTRKTVNTLGELGWKSGGTWNQ